jgi:hypothetical protein
MHFPLSTTLSITTKDISIAFCPFYHHQGKKKVGTIAQLNRETKKTKMNAIKVS